MRILLYFRVYEGFTWIEDKYGALEIQENCTVFTVQKGGQWTHTLCYYDILESHSIFETLTCH